MKLVVGLGNIGARYASTRHNIGFMAADRLAAKLGATWKTEPKLKADIAVARSENGEKLILAKPSTMMNLSGESIQRIVSFYKLAPADVWVIFDDVDVPFGRARIRRSGSAGGHQGLISTIAHLGTTFARVRLGISLNDRAVEPSEVYVLKPFNTDEQAQLPELINAAADLISGQLANAAPTEATFDLLH